MASLAIGVAVAAAGPGPVATAAAPAGACRAEPRRGVCGRLCQRTDLLQAGGHLVIGGLTAATLNVAVQPWWLHAVGGQPVLSVRALDLPAVVLSICSSWL